MIKRLIHYLSAGLIAGLFLALVEAADRTAVLSGFFSSFSEKLLFICGLAFIPIGNLLISLAVAALCALGEAAAKRAGKPIAAPAMAASLMLLILIFPSISHAFQQLLAGAGNRIPQISPLLSHPTLLLFACICIASLILAWLDGSLFEKICSKNAAAGSIAFLSILLSFGFYWIDSRMFVGRYHYFFHIPATIAASGFAFIFGIVLSRRIENKHAVAILLFLISIAAAAIAVYGFNNHQSVNALFWRRGVAAKKYVAAMQHFIDFDRDGFSPFFGGGDCDDRNGACNPLAREISGNGIDENCIGGDGEGKQIDFTDLNRMPLPEKTSKNVLFITIDCLRADHLGCYGYSRKTSPNLDRFASRSVLFENAFSLGTNTGHSFSSIARSAYGEAIFDETVPTIASLLASNGFTTAAVTSPKTDKWLFKQGWESYKKIMLEGVETIVHKKGGYWNSHKLTDKTIEYLQENREKRFYVWVHYNDLHAKNEKYVLQQGAPEFGNGPIDVYDGNLAFTDEHLGRLFAYLESSGLLEETTVAISADHGEEFLEHGQQFHNGRLYREQTHVPLILHYPGMQPQRVKDPVSLIDLGPTFLRASGLQPPREYDGADLAQAAAGSAKDRPVFIETPRNVPQADFFAWAVVKNDWRLVYDLVGNTFELFNEADDPMGRRNLIDREPERARDLKAALGRFLDLQSQRKDYRYWARF